MSESVQFCSCWEQVKSSIAESYNGSLLETVAGKVSAFVQNKDNMKALLSFAIAWGAIFSFLGGLYGFQAVAIPCAIGIGCGMGCGIFIGIVTVAFLDDENKCPNHNTFIKIINSALYTDTWTYYLITTVAVTAVAAAMIQYPTAVGALCGLLMGNQVAVQVGHGGKVGAVKPAGPIDITEIERRMDEQGELIHSQRDTIDELRRRNDELEASHRSLSDELHRIRGRIPPTPAKPLGGKSRPSHDDLSEAAAHQQLPPATPQPAFAPIIEQPSPQQPPS